MKKIQVSWPAQNKRALPLNYEDIQHREKFICKSYTVDSSYIINLEKAYVSPYGVVLKNWRIVKESVYPGYVHNNFYYTFLKKIFLKRVRRIPGLCIVAIYGYYGNYYHFVCDILPRLYNVKNFAADAKVIMHEWAPSFIKEYLTLLGFNNVEYIKDNELAFTEKLLLPTFTAGKHAHNREVMKNLAEILKNNIRNNEITFEGYQNIYVSRRKASYRKVLNEKEVINLVKEYGFKIVYFEDYSVAEQISLMSTVKNLIAVHGAGITNIMYMPENGLVIEMVHPDHHIDCFFNLANVFNHNTIILQGVAEEGSNDPIHDDFSIDTIRLKNYLDTFLK